MPQFGRYEILDELGRGGFGTVYKAEDQVLGRLVALKVLHSALVVDPSFIDLFKQEARTAAKLDHANIVNIFDFGENDGKYYISMAYLPGGSLRDLLKKEGKLSRERTLRIFQQTAAGMTYAHQKNVIHRDLKPGNILLDENENARVSDLGFAKVLSNQSSMTTSMSSGLIGTPAYMAPELWLDQKATKQTDQYSLACILVEMLTATPLFDGQSTPGIMNKHFQSLTLPLEIDDSWRAGIERALQQRPEDRWENLEVFVKNISLENLENRIDANSNSNKNDVGKLSSSGINNDSTNNLKSTGSSSVDHGQKAATNERTDQSIYTSSYNQPDLYPINKKQANAAHEMRFTKSYSSVWDKYFTDSLISADSSREVADLNNNIAQPFDESISVGILIAIIAVILILALLLSS